MLGSGICLGREGSGRRARIGRARGGTGCWRATSGSERAAASAAAAAGAGSGLLARRWRCARARLTGASAGSEICGSATGDKSGAWAARAMDGSMSRQASGRRASGRQRQWAWARGQAVLWGRSQRAPRLCVLNACVPTACRAKRCRYSTGADNVLACSHQGHAQPDAHDRATRPRPYSMHHAAPASDHLPFPAPIHNHAYLPLHPRRPRLDPPARPLPERRSEGAARQLIRSLCAKTTYRPPPANPAVAHKPSPGHAFPPSQASAPRPNPHYPPPSARLRPSCKCEQRTFADAAGKKGPCRHLSSCASPLPTAAQSHPPPPLLPPDHLYAGATRCTLQTR